MSTLASHSPVIEISDLKRDYRTAEGPLAILHGISFTAAAGQSLAIVGPSGSGKTTLLGLCAGLDVPTSGSVRLLGTALETLDEDGRAAFRGEHVGFVFQNFQLIPTLTAVENVAVPLELRQLPGAEEKARALLESVGLSHRMDHYPIQLSGGEQQRVALARAFINDPKILFADEPTGNLDGANGGNITELLFDLNNRQGTTLVLVTHDLGLASQCDQTIRLRDGRVISNDAA
ncbi:MAG: ABC transporter ATP-binding protein [Opitutales bacterium]|nr:ABC transporter ATP-binding protein [Opitutales bacterium]NRA28224.1 ABC transporter ATP-binding protein [Opitutales bacterium]